MNAFCASEKRKSRPNSKKTATSLIRPLLVLPYPTGSVSSVLCTNNTGMTALLDRATRQPKLTSDSGQEVSMEARATFPLPEATQSMARLTTVV